ncbi:MAG: hypothetical protein AB7N71_11560 [Phycisphaerae bacterium]
MMLAVSGGANPYLPLLFVLGLLTLSMTWLRHRTRMRRRQISSRPAKNPQHDQSVSIAHSLHQIMVELEESARRINAQLDTKFVRLERVVEAADRRIAALERSLSQAEKCATNANAASSTPPPRNHRHGTTAAKPAPNSEASDPRFHEIYRLADAGTAAREIANAVKMPIGEVEVVLNLRNQF